jgi:DNA-binding NtrC family response regulator
VVLADTLIEKAHLSESPLTQTVVKDELMPALWTAADIGAMPLKDIVKRETARVERQVIVQTLEATRWNRSLTAKRLEIDYKTLYNKMKEYSIG